MRGTCTRTPCEYWHPPECQCYKNESGCKAGDKCLFPHYKVEEQPNKRSRKRATISHPKKRESDDKNAVAVVKIVSQLSCVSQDSDALVCQCRTSRENPMQKSLGTASKSTVHSVYATSSKYPGKKGPSLGKTQVQHPHQRSPYAVNFEDRSQEETERQQRCRSKAWMFAKNIHKLREKDKATFYSPAEEWALPAASTKEPEEREFVVDSRAGMHMVSKKDLNSTREEATVHVQELDLFVTVVLLEETPAVLSLGKLCEDHGYTYHWTRSQNPHLTKNGKIMDCNISNYVPFVVPGLSTSSSTSSSPTSSTSSSHTPKIQYPKEVEVRVRSCGETRCINQQKPKTIRKMDAKKYKAIYCMICRIGCRSSEKNLLMKVLQQSDGETQSEEVKTLPSLLINFQWSREHKWNWARASTVSTLTFRWTRIVISLLEDENNKGFLQKTYWHSRDQSGTFW